MGLEPKPGLVIRYDYLWKDEAQSGQEHGSKDRPCAIVLTSTPDDDGAKTVVLCAITHSPPSDEEYAIAIPAKVAAHLGLDDQQSWIKTHEVNTVQWEEGRIPFGVSPAEGNQWAFGSLPQALGKQVFDRVRDHMVKRTLKNIRRS